MVSRVANAFGAMSGDSFDVEVGRWAVCLIQVKALGFPKVSC